MSDVAQIGQEMEIIKVDGKFQISVKGSNPPDIKRLVIDRNMDIQLGDGRKFTLISNHPGLMLEEVELPRSEFRLKNNMPAPKQAAERRFRDIMQAGVSFMILS